MALDCTDSGWPTPPPQIDANLEHKTLTRALTKYPSLWYHWFGPNRVTQEVWTLAILRLNRGRECSTFCVPGLRYFRFLSNNFVATKPQVLAFVDALELSEISYSWTGVTSLAVAYDFRSTENRPDYGHRIVRLNIGL